MGSFEMSNVLNFKHFVPV